jgi:manganese transport protein
LEIIKNPAMLYVAIGILGATVMPHNLYLHSSIVQTRKYEQNSAGKREAIKFATIDSTVALMFALFINAAILIVSAATFHTTGQTAVAEIQDAYKLLSPTLGVTLASTVFALALLASGQNSTLTGTLAGQIVMEGFLNIRLRPWLRRLITRLIAIVPAIIITAIYANDTAKQWSAIANLIIFSQVVLSLQLSFAVIPLILFTSDRRKMGEFVIPLWMKTLAWVTATIIVTLNAKYLADFFGVTAWVPGKQPGGPKPAAARHRTGHAARLGTPARPRRRRLGRAELHRVETRRVRGNAHRPRVSV